MKRTILGVIFGALILSSCAIHSGTMTGNASISSSDFKFLGQANGHAKTVKVFGIGGLQKNGLVAKAKEDLYYNSKLSKGQALANVSVDFKRSFYVVVSVEDVYINADVIDFNIKKGTGKRVKRDRKKGR